MKLKKWQIVVIVIVVIGAISAMNGGSKKEENTENNEPNASEETKEKEYGVGETLIVGDVEFMVNTTETADTIGSEYVNKAAQNKFLILDITLKNNGDEALTISNSFFKLMKDDKEFEASTDAGIYVQDGKSIIFEKVNPESSLTGKVIFDVTEETINASNLKLQVQTGAFGTEKGLINLH